MAHTTSRGSARGVRLAAAVSLALTVATVTAACGSTAPAPPTARVERGQVSTKVSASGALAAVSSQNLGLDKAVRSPLVHGDGRSVDQLRRIYDATKDSGDALHSKDQNAVFRARQTLDFARQQYRAAVQAYQTCLNTPLSMMTGALPTGSPSACSTQKTAIANAYGGTGGVLQSK